MNLLAERYVKLVLQVGQHDGDFVDAYYGNPAWKPTGPPVALAELTQAASALRREIAAVVLPSDADELTRLRRDYLDKQMAAVEARLEMLQGKRLTFDEESTRLYDAQAPAKTTAEFQAVRDTLERLLPGRGELIDRFATFRNGYVIPPAKVDAVFRAAIEGCRARTVERLTLPRGETFTVEYVTGKSWSAYNWYKGNFTSVIQVNTDLPITIDRAIDLACHEGYPGHHVYNALLERTLVRDRKLGGVLGLPVVLAAVAHRGRHRELRHRGGVPRRGADEVRARDALSARRPGSEDRGSLQRRYWRLSTNSATRATKPRASTSTDRSTVPPPRPGCRSGRSRPRIAPNSGSGSSTSIGATSSTTTSARISCAGTSKSAAGRSIVPTCAGRSSASCCRRPDCRRGSDSNLLSLKLEARSEKLRGALPGTGVEP